ncbi:MAG: tRNA (guanosine(37)-N1)-methyltransferase TrmD [Muribaculaceae bacterium]|nr:tRNA (guanosine(37)-N1)-methyltransferase TrmD [Muribaculaceae bacterium]
MKIHVLTLFPDMIRECFKSSIIGKAVQREILSLHVTDIRDHTLDRHKKVDDYPYGGGAGMLMQAQPVFDAWMDVAGGRNVRTIYVTPQGTPFSQRMAEELAKEEELVFLCGHYEGIDQRVLEETVTDYVSIGDYVLTGGELPAMVMIDAVARLIPGVLGNGSSAEEESFSNDLLEYPQYSRPEVWHDRRVPDILLSGNHRKISQWRLEQSRQRTARVRPDLYAKYERKQQLIGQLMKDKRNHIHMIESLRRGRAEILWWEGNDILLYDRRCATCLITASSEASGEKMLGQIPEETVSIVTSRAFLNEMLCGGGAFGKYEIHSECLQLLYTQKVPLPVKHKDIRRLAMEHLDYVSAHYSYDDRTYVEARIREGAMYGAFADGRQVGFVGTHSEGSLGMLYVEEAYRRQGIAVSLESYLINRALEKGWIPYGHVIVGNVNSFALQEKLGLYRSDKTVWWLERK